MEDVKESRTLSNGLTLEIRDQTRIVAEDSVFVRAEIRIPMEGEVFTKLLEKKFVHVKARDAVFAELVESHLAQTLAYYSHPEFAARYRMNKNRIPR